MKVVQNKRVMHFAELIDELWLSDQDLTIIYGECGLLTRVIAKNICVRIAKTLVDWGVTRGEFLAMQFGVCCDDKSKIYILMGALVQGLLPHELLDDYLRGDLSVIDWDHNMLALRNHANHVKAVFFNN